MIILTSKDNPLLKTIRLVASGSRRAPGDLVLAEGVRSIEEAVRADRVIEAVLCAPGFGSFEREAALLRSLSDLRVKLCRTSDRVLKSVSEVQTPQGILALVRVPAAALKDWSPGRNPLLLCACGLQDPGNLGTLLRTAAAVDISMVCLTPDTVSARNPKAVRASAGAFFQLAVSEPLPLAEILAYCAEHSITPYLADTRGKILYTDIDYTIGTALLLGNEGRGVAHSFPAGVESVRIPMAPGVESLNVGVAGALLLFEAFRQRAASAGKLPRP